jgi:molybdopterin biosynthesis enzyme
MDAEPPLRIARLTPLADVLALIGARVMPVAARASALADAIGRVLAQHAVVPAAVPGTALALRDGYAVRSEETADANSYAPAVLATKPLRVGIGDRFPSEFDAVAPLDVVTGREARCEALSPVPPGEGVLSPGADLAARAMVRSAGERVRPADVAALIAGGVAQVNIRSPRVLVIWCGGDRRTAAGAHLVMSAIRAAGGEPLGVSAPQGNAPAWDKALRRTDCDFIVALGGPSSGSTKETVRALAGIGEVAVHGLAIAPGETAAVGFAEARPVLLLPGRVDAAFAVWQLLGAPILARLEGCTEEPPVTTAALTRKVSSSLGLAELVLVRIRDGKAEPIASGYLPLSALTQADGWVLIAPESEGYPPGAEVVIRRCA